mmetsp:Transcript_10525/g.25617  ORF Transcript_10525/g.25617 Transcript_10525/m.25617 type:complete len:200 (-) Transcript_10525:495-1094(-)
MRISRKVAEFPGIQSYEIVPGTCRPSLGWRLCMSCSTHVMFLRARAAEMWMMRECRRTASSFPILVAWRYCQTLVLSSSFSASITTSINGSITPSSSNSAVSFSSISSLMSPRRIAALARTSAETQFFLCGSGGSGASSASGSCTTLPIFVGSTFMSSTHRKELAGWSHGGRAFFVPFASVVRPRSMRSARLYSTITSS